MKKMRYPAQFNLKKHMDSVVDGSKLDSIADEVYDLFGVVIHSGYSTSSGHYFSYCKTSDNKWFECDDSSIRPSNESTAL